MNFQELLAKMQQLDRPASTVEQVTDEMGCGDMSQSMPPSMPPANEPPVAPPSMSINLNAQGMDNIEDLMKLVTKVNPDMDKPNLPPLPSMGDMPSIASIKPAMPPLKMLPDLDSEPEGDHPEPDADNFGGPSDNDADNKIDVIQKSMGDIDGDGDHDMDDHDAEKKDKKDEKEAFGNSPIGGSEPETKGLDAAIPDGDDLNKPKKSFSGKPYRGDNPMAANAYESTDLRAQIRAELQRRLTEAKKS